MVWLHKAASDKSRVLRVKDRAEMETLPEYHNASGRQVVAPLCPWMTVPRESRYPRVKSNVTFSRFTDCLKELIDMQTGGDIEWIPAAGTLLQAAALGGSHGQRNDDDLDLLLITTLNRTAEEHCTNNAIGNHFFHRVESINEATLNSLNGPNGQYVFANRCICGFRV